MLTKIRLLIIFCFAHLPLLQGGEDSLVKTRLDQYLTKAEKEGHFSGSVLIAKGSEILLNKGYGYADLDHLIPNTPQTVFRIASVSKQFGAAAILQLRDKGLLSLDNSISKHLLDYPKDKGDKITIFHLLTHTSGVPSLTEFPNLSRDSRQEVSLHEVIGSFKNMPLEFEPGSQFSYSDSGYILIGAIIEKVTGLPYGEYLKNNLFSPLEMSSTGYFHNTQVVPHRATGYSLRNDGKLSVAPYIDLTYPHVAGALSATTEDLYKWDRALYGTPVLSEQSIHEMLSKQAGNEKTQYFYGFGFRVGSRLLPDNREVEDFNQPVVGHFGTIEGFRAAIFRYLNDHVCIIVLSNQEKIDVTQIQKDLAQIVFNTYPEPINLSLASSWPWRH